MFFFLILKFYLPLFKIKGQQIPAFKCSLKNQTENSEKWFAAHSKEEARLKAVAHFNSEDIDIQQGAERVSFY